MKIEQDYTRTPVAYGYARVSHSDTFKQGDSLPSQLDRIKKYYDANLAGEGVSWGGADTDGTNVSAYRVMFHCRPAGKRILQKLKPGDHLVVDKIDRFWRSLEDFILLMRSLRAQNITVHIVSFLGSTVKNDTPMGDFILQLFVMIAEMESGIKSERIKEALLVKRGKGLLAGKHAPPGCRVHKIRSRGSGKDIRKLEWCEQTRTIMAEIVRLIDDERLEWSQAHPKIEEFCAKIQAREVRKIAYQMDDRNNTWPKWYKYETAYRYLGIKTPEQIPVRKVISEAARQHKRRRTAQRGRQGCYSSAINEIPPEVLLDLTSLTRTG